MKNIVLGIYTSPHFTNISKIDGNCSYPFTEIIGDFWVNVDGDDCILDTVSEAASHSDKIIFLLDEIEFPLSKIPYTCRELKLIVSNPEFKQKTIFMLDNLILTKRKVDNILQLIN